MGKILLLPFSHNCKETVGRITHSISDIERVFIFCPSQEEFNFVEFNNIQLKPVQVSLPDGFSRQVETVNDFLKSNISGDDQLYLYLEEHTPLEHLIHLTCAALYQKQTVFISKDKQIKIEKNSNEESGLPVLVNHIKELVYSGNYRSASTLSKNQLKNNRLNQLIQFGEKLFRMDLSYQPSMGEIHPVDHLINTLVTEEAEEESEKKFLQIFKGLEKGNQKAFIYFLHNYAEFLYEERDTIDFIVLFYRLVEETLLYALGWDVNGQNSFCKRKDAVYHLRFPEWKLTKHYHRYLKALTQYVRQIENTSNKQRGMELLSTEEVYFTNLHLLFQNKSLNKCIEFRHEGVSGHGFADLTKSELEAICGGVSPLDLFEPILDRYDLKPEYSIFSLLNKAIMIELQEEGKTQILTR